MTSNLTLLRAATLVALLLLSVSPPAAAAQDAPEPVDALATSEAPATSDATATSDALATEPDPPAPAHSRGARAVLHQQLVALLNPMGAEHRLELGLRDELGNPDDILTSLAHIEGGIATAVSPVYAMGGGYLQVAPVSFLVLRGEIVGATVWPIGMSGAGHYALGGYGADVRAQALPAENAGTASGWLATVSATLQGALDLTTGVRLLLLSELGLTRAVMGEAPFYYSMKHDLVLAREDFVLTSSSFLGMELRAASDLVVRFGAYDDLRHVPGSGYVGHQVGPVVMLEWAHPAPMVGSLAIFVRGGGYTHHVTREGEATILGGVAVDYELGGL